MLHIKFNIKKLSPLAEGTKLGIINERFVVDTMLALPSTCSNQDDNDTKNNSITNSTDAFFATAATIQAGQLQALSQALYRMFLSMTPE